MSNTAEYIEKIKTLTSKWVNADTCKVYAWVVFCILFLFLASNSAKLFWSFFSDYRGGGSASSQTQTKEEKDHSYLKALLETRVFPVIPEKMSMAARVSGQSSGVQGAEADAVEQKPAKPAGPVKLPLVITGILASDHRNKSQVIIQYRNEEVLYGEGDAIEGTAARVSHIMDNRVEIFNSGRIDVYFLDDDNKVPSPPPVARRPNTTGSNAPSRPGGALGKHGSAAPASNLDFMDYVSISPVKEGAAVKGYRLNPGKKPELFTKAGFRENDLATSVNGYDLTDPAQTKKLFAEYKNMQNFEITVDRGGVTENIYINLGEIEASK